MEEKKTIEEAMDFLLGKAREAIEANEKVAELMPDSNDKNFKAITRRIECMKIGMEFIKVIRANSEFLEKNTDVDIITSFIEAALSPTAILLFRPKNLKSFCVGVVALHSIHSTDEKVDVKIGLMVERESDQRAPEKTSLH